MDYYFPQPSFPRHFSSQKFTVSPGSRVSPGDGFALINRGTSQKITNFRVFYFIFFADPDSRILTQVSHRIRKFGYQTNTYVYGSGGYRFGDFAKIGIPLNIILWITATYLIPKFWAF